MPIIGDHEVAVAGTEYRQASLARYAPRADGRARHVAVELAPAPVTQGAHAGMSGIEVWLDRVRIGELTARFGQAYAPLVNDVLHLLDLRAAAPPGRWSGRTAVDPPSPRALRRVLAAIGFHC